VIDTHPPVSIDRTLVTAFAEGFDEVRAPDALVDFRGSSSLVDIRRATGGRDTETASVIGEFAYSSAFLQDVSARALPIVERYHDDHPKRPGLANAELASQLAVARDVVDHVVSLSSELSETSGTVHLASFSDELTAEDEAAWQRAREIMELSFDVPRTSQLPIEAELLHALVRRGDLVQIEPDLAFTSTQIESILSGVSDLPDGFTVSAFKDHFGMSRRQAVPLLEWLDKRGVTLRQGDGRVMRKP
jgi:selenocysteine-specific elongation factor